MENDPRVQRTKHLLASALIELAKSKSLLKLTVRELTAKAGINRATFYRHYGSVSEFVDGLIDDLLDGLVAAHKLESGSNIDERTYYRSWLQFAQENSELFQALLSTNGAPEFEQRLVQNGVDAWSYILRPARVEDLDKTTAAYIATYVTSAHVGVLRHWLNGGCAESLDYMCALLYRMTVQGCLTASGLSAANELPY